MANTTIPSELIADGSVVTAKIANDAVDADKLASNAVVTASIADDAVTLAKMAANSIDSDQYVDGSIDTIHIADGAITSAKLDTNIAVGGTLTVTGDANFDSNTLFVDASANAVGIGTTSPDAKLRITGAYENLFIAAGTNGVLTVGNPSANLVTMFSGTSDALALGTSSTERLRIDSSGRVGIGVVPSTIWSSSYDALQIGLGGSVYAHDGAASNMHMAANSVYEGTAPNYYDKYLTSSTASKYVQDSGIHIWSTAASGTAGNAITWSEAMRIDTSGNLLVGTTDTFVADNSSGNGLSYRASAGDLGVAASNTPAFYANRMGSDGTIADFRKNGTAVGSIGTSGGLFNIGSGDTGLLFVPASDLIVPSNPTDTANGGKDAAIDLGNIYNRFKDLYLSGGVYLGGTGSANKLDDYEEGTWTPSFNTGTWASVANFTYTKIGRLVHVTGYLAGPSNAPNGNLIISGFPFPANADYNMFPLWYAGAPTTIAYAYMFGNQTSITVRPVNGGVNTMTELSVQMVYTTT